MNKGAEMLLAQVAKLIPQQLWDTVQTGVKSMLDKVSAMDARQKVIEEKLDEILTLLKNPPNIIKLNDAGIFEARNGRTD